MTKSELEERVRYLEYTLHEILVRTKSASAHYENLGYGSDKDLAIEKNPYYVIGAVNHCVTSIAHLAQTAVPILV